MTIQATQRRAVGAGVMGITAVVLACLRERWLPLIALPLGVLALSRGISTAVTAVRSGPSPHRRKILVPAILGGVFGGLAIPLCVLLVLSGVFSGNRRQAWRDPSFGQVPEPAFARSEKAGAFTNFTSNLPIIVLHAGGEDIPSEGEALMRAQFFDTDPGSGRASLGAKAAHDGDVTIHVRGSSSQRLPKSSFTFHTMQQRTNQVKVSLLGLPKEEDWVLYAPFEDKTMIRDVLAFELARRSGHYAPRTRYAEVFITRSAGRVSMRDYAGVYVLMEKIKRGANRVNLAKLDPGQGPGADLSGGYIVKRDHQDRREPRFSTGRGGPYFFVYPDSRKVTPQQRAWLVRYFRTFETALYGPDFANPQTGYAAYLDVDSFIDAHWLIEMSKNVDGFRYSAFITKDRGGKLKTEPPWDWNRSFGNANYYGGGQPKGWYWPRIRPNEISWYQRLREDPEFNKRCNARWVELRRDAFDTTKVLALVDSLAAQLDEAQKRNFKRWPILGEQVTCNHYVGDTYEEEIRWLKSWISSRVAWVDRQVGAGGGKGTESDGE